MDKVLDWVFSPEGAIVFVLVLAALALYRREARQWAAHVRQYAPRATAESRVLPITHMQQIGKVVVPQTIIVTQHRWVCTCPKGEHWL